MKINVYDGDKYLNHLLTQSNFSGAMLIVLSTECFSWNQGFYHLQPVGVLHWVIFYLKIESCKCMPPYCHQSREAGESDCLQHKVSALLMSWAQGRRNWCCAASSLLNARLSGSRKSFWQECVGADLRSSLRLKVLTRNEHARTNTRMGIGRERERERGTEGERERDVTQSAPWTSVWNQLNIFFSLCSSVSPSLTVSKNSLHKLPVLGERPSF